MRRTYVPAALIMYVGILTSATAQAQIETLVMPGKVIEGHAEVETECSSCHLAFDKTKQRALCLDCHEDVASDIDGNIGFHGLSKDASEVRCASCHTDHEGREADIVQLNINTFDHDLTDFPLEGGHTETECSECHSDDEKYRDAPSNCFACHEPDNVHEDTMGEACEDCHTPKSWDDVEFDHDTTDFSLIGKHLEASCLDCHEDQTFQELPMDCFNCHEDDDAHDGKSGEECENCHNPTDWHDTSFDHDRDTEFALLGRHSELACDDCHSDDPFSDEMQTNCVSCHLEDDNHDGHFGDSCETCHTSEEWPAIAFDHDIDTDHPLIGAHESVECTACHIEPIFEIELLGNCNDCHEDDDPHEGTQGAQCQDCHDEASWEDKVFFDHDLTNFPLLGKHADEECESCHDSHRFTDAPLDCKSCHREDDPHRGNFHDRCDACHNPVDWESWIFDHDAQTEFPLDGAHVDVTCEGCHRSSLDKIKSIDGSCRNCHRADDVHDGEFGSDCGRCHTADSFREVRSLQ
ncbi:MAG: cytochrome C [Gammaproteobacteria bacterium]|nr:cytochrome C [Gammaproteobacteria bacterium]